MKIINKQNKMTYMTTFQGTNYQNNNPLINNINQKVTSTPQYQTYQSYRINPQKFRQQTSYVDSQLERSLKFIQNIKKQLPSFSNYSMVNTSSNMAKNSALIQSKYEVSRISEQPDDEASNESFDDASTTVQSVAKPQYTSYVKKSDNLMSMNVNRSEVVSNLPLKQSFTKVSSRFSSFQEQKLQIEEEKIYCVICQQTYLLLNQKDHLLKHKNKCQRQFEQQQKQQKKDHIRVFRQVQETVKPQQLSSGIVIGSRQRQMPQYSMNKSVTFGSHLSMQNSYSISIQSNKKSHTIPQVEPQQVNQVQQRSNHQSQSSDHSSFNQIPNTVETGIQVSLSNSNIKSNPKSQSSFVRSKQSRNSQPIQNSSIKPQTQKVLIQLDHYELSSKSSSSQQSGSFAAFSQDKMINHQPQSIMNFRIHPDNQSDIFKKSAKSLQCTYGKTFLQAQNGTVSDFNNQKSKNSKSSADKEVQKLVDSIKEKSLTSKHSQKSRKSSLVQKRIEATPYFKQIVTNDPPTLKQIPTGDRLQRLGFKTTGKVQKVDRPSCQQQSIMSMSDISMRIEDQDKRVNQQKQLSIREYDYRSERNMKTSNQNILIQESRRQTQRIQVSPFKKSSKPRVQQVNIEQPIRSERPHEQQIQSQKAAVSMKKTNSALKRDNQMGLGVSQPSQSGRSKKAKNIFAQSQKGQRRNK